ncbi:LacI family DNA-binding transcriptional regulator [Arthrobacter sp. M2012083]|uniref:LacI family DNA-binding transcriptional regulator n=1 Tax=Arthrobacter sp. M2012083 TaxID=1197706 RepID=UPI0002E83FC3|nr:LacI family DNA-binding transcriptional regulator [Arthrobacter sp. M2012083]
MAKGPTVYHVAERAGVSIATVSFTFRQPEKVKASTREAVLAAAEALGYVPSASARGLARGRTGALGLFAYDYLLDPAHGRREEGLADPDPLSTESLGNEDLRLFPLYVDEVQRGVELECWRRGQALFVGGGNPENNEAVLSDIAGRVDGLAVFPRSVPSEVLARIARRIPVVEVSESELNRDLDHVTVDNASGIRAMTEHLLSEHGMTRLMFLGGMPSSDNDQRLRAFLGTLHDSGLSPANESKYPCGSDEGIAEVVASLCNDGNLPDAIVCATDQDALMVLDSLAAAGISVPTEVAVTGFDGIAAGRVVRPSLTTVRQPMEQMGRTLVRLLLERLDHPEKPPAAVRLPIRLVVRESCGCKAG